MPDDQLWRDWPLRMRTYRMQASRQNWDRRNSNPHARDRRSRSNSRSSFNPIVPPLPPPVSPSAPLPCGLARSSPAEPSIQSQMSTSSPPTSIAPLSCYLHSVTGIVPAQPSAHSFRPRCFRVHASNAWRPPNRVQAKWTEAQKIVQSLTVRWLPSARGGGTRSGDPSRR